MTDRIYFPYGLGDFYRLMTQNRLFIDRTAYIRVLENKGDALLLLRPRRFGKTLLLSILENYYDVNKATDFDRLFGHLASGGSCAATLPTLPYFVSRYITWRRTSGS